MYIYKITNKINGKWYIGKHNGKNPNYMGSGKLLKYAVSKYGIDNFYKEILEECISEEQLNRREKEILSETNAPSDPESYNLANGGEGGDLSKFIPYDKIDYSNYKMSGTKLWYQSLTQEEKDKFHANQAENRTKGWYVSRLTDPTEIYVQNISKWCEIHNVDKSMPTCLNDPTHRLFQKQTKGWRIRRSDMPLLPPYIDKRINGHPNIACKGKGWKLVNGKRVWYDK
jgi:hypothetical protein